MAPQVANPGLRGAMLRRSGQTIPAPQKTLRDILAVLHDNLRPLGGLVAQLVEQCPFKALVVGSSPTQPTISFPWKINKMAMDKGIY